MPPKMSDGEGTRGSFSVPLDVRLRLCVVSTMTGDPESTLREAIDKGDLRAVKRGKALYTTLLWHREWVDSEGEIKGRGNDTRPPKREVPRKAESPRAQKPVLGSDGGPKAGRPAGDVGEVARTPGRGAGSGRRVQLIDLRPIADRADALSVVEGGG